MLFFVELMVQPKQIIYPLSYFRAMLAASEGERIKFEEAFAAFINGQTHVFSIGRARGGIFLLAKLLAQGRKNQVILSPYTIPDVINMVRFAGCEPIFVDCLPRSTNVDLDHLTSLMNARTCCVLITHYHFNQSCMADIRSLCRARGIALVDDCALALGGRDFGNRIGCTTSASVFSLSGFKALNFFWGGVISTGSDEFAKQVSREVSSWPTLRRWEYVSQMLRVWKYDFATRRIGFAAVTFPLLRRRALQKTDAELLPMVRVETNEISRSILSRPAPQAAREWNRKLDTIDSVIIHRRTIGAIYDGYLGERVVGADTSAEVRDGSCLVNYPIIVEPRCRAAIFKSLLSRGFDVGFSLYPNVHEMGGFEAIDGRSTNVSELTNSVLTLPTHPRITAEYAERLAKATVHAIDQT